MRPALAVCCALVLSACGHGGDTGSTQVAVRVDGTELSVHQVNTALAALPANAPDLDQRKRDIVNSLVDQQLAANQAIAQKMERSPGVVIGLEEARRLVLAQTYLQSYSAKLPKPTSAEIETYLNAHPELFAQRRAYELLELKAVAGDTALTEQLRTQYKSVSSLADLAAQLTRDGRPFELRLRQVTADNLPLEMAGKLATLPVNTLTDYDDPVLGFELVQIKDFKVVPILAEDARPLIGKFLSNQRMQLSLKEQMTRLRGTSKIEYFGELQALYADAAKKSD